jgi:hypothetical protein
MHGTAEENFDFFHSSSRIVVEYAFGEIDLRWGILWRSLQFLLDLNSKVIDASMCLHEGRKHCVLVVDVQTLTKPTVKWWGDVGETNICLHKNWYCSNNHMHDEW